MSDGSETMGNLLLICRHSRAGRNLVKMFIQTCCKEHKPTPSTTLCLPFISYTRTYLYHRPDQALKRSSLFWTKTQLSLINSWNDRSVLLQSWLFAHGSTCIAIVYHQWAVEWNSTYMWTYVLHDDSIWVTIYIACKVICCLLLFSPIRLSPLFTSLSLPFPNLPLFLLKQLTVVPYRIHWTVW